MCAAAFKCALSSCSLSQKKRHREVLSPGQGHTGQVENQEGKRSLCLPAAFCPQGGAGEPQPAFVNCPSVPCVGRGGQGAQAGFPSKYKAQNPETAQHSTLHPGNLHQETPLGDKKEQATDTATTGMHLTKTAEIKNPHTSAYRRVSPLR